MQDFTIRLKAYGREQISEDLSAKLSDILATLVEIFALSTKAIKRGRLVKFTRNVLLGTDDAIKAAVSKLDKLTKVEATLAGAETLTEAKRTGRIVDTIQTTVTSTDVTVKETGMAVNQMTVQVNEVHEMLGNLLISANGKDEKHGDSAKSQHDLVRNILQPSATVSAQDWYDKLCKTRVSGTGDWIRREGVFQGWMDRDLPVMFISGNPGAGKSYLTSSIVSFLRDEYPQGVQHPSHVSVGYFFFKDDNPTTRSFHQALRDVAYQISRNDPAYEKYLASLGEYGSASTLESAWRTLYVNYFLKKVSITSSVYILFDAVDEAFEEERLVFLQLAKDVLDSPNRGHLQLAMVGRPHISDQLDEALETNVPTIHVTTQKNSADIDRYIKTSIQKSVILRRVSPALRKEIAEKLSAGAEGMFIWVNLMLQELVKKRNESSIRKSLEQAPRGLREMLRHVLMSFSASLNDEELEFLNELLLWAACAVRPLTLGEMEAILELMSAEGDGMIYLEGALRKQYTAFFNLDRADGLATTELQALADRAYMSDDGAGPKEESDEDEAFEDIENIVEFDSDKKSTTVIFSHASLGDFFRNANETKVSAAEGRPAVGVVYNDAKLYVLKTCLKILTDPEFSEKAKDPSVMLTYAASNWVQHLHLVQPSETPLEVKKDIASMLARMFGMDDYIAKWVPRRKWVSTSENLRAIHGWWDDPRVLESLADKEAEFVRSAKEKPGETFRPIAEFCARKWLADDKALWPIPDAAAIIASYLKFQRGVDENFSPSFAPTAAEVIAAAEWAQMEKTSCWYQRIGVVLRLTSHFDEALEYFRKAAAIDPNNWMAKASIASAHMKRKEWEAAVVVNKEVEAFLEKQLIDEPDQKEFLTGLLVIVLHRMATCYEELGEEEKQYIQIKKALAVAPSDEICIYRILCFHHETGRFEETISLVKEFTDAQVPNKDYSRLTEFLWEMPIADEGVIQYLAYAGQATGNLELIVHSYRDAARTARTLSMTVVAAHLDLSLARIYSEYTREEDKAIKGWMRILDTYGSAKVIASSKLAQLWLCHAIDAGVGSPEAEEYVTRLEQLVARYKTEDTSALWVTARARAFALGVWYRLIGRHDDARALIAPSVKRAIQVLSDDDPENDREGLTDLQNALLAAGDAKNVIAIAYALGDVLFGCDGPCRKVSRTMGGISLCSICFDTGFCSHCVEVLRTGDFPFRVCNAKHVKDFVYIPPRPQEIEAGRVLVEGQVLTYEEWLAQLKKEWKL